MSIKKIVFKFIEYKVNGELKNETPINIRLKFSSTNLHRIYNDQNFIVLRIKVFTNKRTDNHMTSFVNLRFHGSFYNSFI